MLRYENKGYTLEINLPEECGHEGYSVECQYIYDKNEEKYRYFHQKQAYFLVQRDKKNRTALLAPCNLT